MLVSVVEVLFNSSTEASVAILSEILAFLKSGAFEGEGWAVVASWEQRTPSVMASMTTPPSSTLGVGQGWLKSSAEAPNDGVTGLKSSGVPEETDGGVLASLGEV